MKMKNKAKKNEWNNGLPFDPQETMASESDPMGMYTGVPLKGYEPEQDADDL